MQHKKAETNARKRMQDFGRHAHGIENLIKPLEKMHQAEVRGSKQFGWSVPSALKRSSGFGALRNRGKRGAKEKSKQLASQRSETGERGAQKALQKQAKGEKKIHAKN